jgi:vacuolar-type H+-ATPase subunit H
LEADLDAEREEYLYNQKYNKIREL